MNQLTPFHSKEWGTLLKEVHGIGVSGETGMPLSLIRSRIFGNRLISVPFSDYGGPSSKTLEEASEAAGAARSEAERMGVDFLEVRTPVMHGDSLEKAGYARRDDYCTFVIDLEKPEERLLSSMEKRTRNDISKGQKSGFDVVEAEGPEDIKRFYGLYAGTMKRLGSPPQPMRFFTAMKEFLGKEACIRMAYIGKEPLAGAVFLKGKGRIHYYYSCSSLSQRNLRASDFLLWDSISGFRKGFREFDFGRTRPGSGVYHYKKGWGGREERMPYYYVFNRKTLDKRQEVGYERYSRMWKALMPGFLAKKLGPWIIRQVG